MLSRVGSSAGFCAGARGLFGRRTAEKRLVIGSGEEGTASATCTGITTPDDVERLDVCSLVLSSPHPVSVCF